MEHDKASENLAKIAFRTAATVEHPEIVEIMWAIPRDDGTYVVDNSPFDAYGISLGDRIIVKQENSALEFQSVAERGGHSTYRVKLHKGAGHSQFLKYWSQLGLWGCSYEGAGGMRRLYSIDVPRSAPIREIYQYLQDIENKGGWEFEEAHYFNPEAPVEKDSES